MYIPKAKCNSWKGMEVLERVWLIKWTKHFWGTATSQPIWKRQFNFEKADGHFFTLEMENEKAKKV